MCSVINFRSNVHGDDDSDYDDGDDGDGDGDGDDGDGDDGDDSDGEDGDDDDGDNQFELLTSAADQRKLFTLLSKHEIDEGEVK